MYRCVSTACVNRLISVHTSYKIERSSKLLRSVSVSQRIFLKGAVFFPEWYGFILLEKLCIPVVVAAKARIEP